MCQPASPSCPTALSPRTQTKTVLAAAVRNIQASFAPPGQFRLANPWNPRKRLADEQHELTAIASLSADRRENHRQDGSRVRESTTSCENSHTRYFGLPSDAY